MFRIFYTLHLRSRSNLAPILRIAKKQSEEEQDVYQNSTRIRSPLIALLSQRAAGFLFTQPNQQVDTCRVVFSPPRCFVQLPHRGQAKLERMFGRATTPETWVRVPLPVRARVHPFQNARNTETQFSSGVVGTREPFSSHSGKTNSRCRRKIARAWRDRAQARRSGAGTAAETEVLLLHSPFAPPPWPFHPLSFASLFAPFSALQATLFC